jgi:hypothetical protein
MHPKEANDFDKWLHQEHLDVLAKIPGYRRTLGYKLGPKVPFSQGGDAVPGFLAIHELDGAVKAGPSEQLEKMNETKWMKEMLKDCEIFVARAWRLVKAEGN